MIEQSYKTRLELEKVLREEYKDKNSLADFCINQLELEINYKFSAPYIVLLHWCIDRLIKGGQVTIQKAPIMSMLTMRWKTDLEKGVKLKINAYKPSDEYLQNFAQRLAALIANQQAFLPKDDEGLDLDLLSNQKQEVKKVKKGEDLELVLSRLKILEEKFEALEEFVKEK